MSRVRGSSPAQGPCGVGGLACRLSPHIWCPHDSPIYSLHRRTSPAVAVGRPPAPQDPGPRAKRSPGWGSCSQCGSPPGSLAPGTPPGLLRARGGPGPEEGGPRQPLPTCLPRSPVPAAARLFHPRGPGLALSGCPCPEERGQEGGRRGQLSVCPGGVAETGLETLADSARTEGSQGTSG